MFITLVWRVNKVKTQTTAEDDGSVIRFYRYETGTCKILCSCWTKVNICAKAATRSCRQNKMWPVLIRSHLFPCTILRVWYKMCHFTFTWHDHQEADNVGVKGDKAAKTVTVLWHRWKVIRRPHNGFQLCSCWRNQMLIMRPQNIFSSGILIHNVIFPNLNQVFFMRKPDQGMSRALMNLNIRSTTSIYICGLQKRT